MKCNVCQDDMIGSKSGWMCLNCGNAVTNKPADTPLIIGESSKRNEPAKVPVGDDSVIITGLSRPTLTHDPAPVIEADASADAKPVDDTVAAVKAEDAVVAAQAPAPVNAGTGTAVTGHEATSVADETANPLEVPQITASAETTETKADTLATESMVAATAEVKSDVPAVATEAASLASGMDGTHDTSVAVVGAQGVGQDQAGATDDKSADEVVGSPAVVAPEARAEAATDQVEAGISADDTAGAGAVTGPTATGEPVAVAVDEPTTQAVAAEPDDSATDATASVDVSEVTPVAPVADSETPAADRQATSSPAAEAVPGTAAEGAVAEPVAASAITSVEAAEASDEPTALTAPEVTGDACKLEQAEVSESSDEPLVAAPMKADVSSGAVAKPDVATPASVETVEARPEPALAGAVPTAGASAPVANEVKAGGLEGAIDGVGSGRGSAVLNLKPTTESLARQIDRNAPAVDAIGRIPVAAGDLHNANLAAASVASIAPAQGVTPAEAVAEPATPVAPASIEPAVAATVPAGEPAAALPVTDSAASQPAAAPLASREDALKQALGADVAERIAATEASTAKAAKAPDFWSQISTPPVPKAAGTPAVRSKAIAGVITGVALVAIVFGGFYFFNHTSGLTTALLPKGSTKYSGTSLARVTSGGADAGTKSDVASPTPAATATPVAVKTLPGGQTDATRLAGRDARRKADVAGYAAAYKKTATNGYYLTNAPAVTVDAADPSTAKPYVVQPGDVTATGQIRYWAGGQCTAKPVTPGATSTRYLALQTKLEDGTVYCLDVK